MTTKYDWIREYEVERDRAIKLQKSNEGLAQALRLISVPIRADGTWNRDRLACQILAKEALGYFYR